MGNIGPARQRYDVLPVGDFGLEDAPRLVPARRAAAMTVPSPEPMPAPHPQPTPEPVPNPEPSPVPGPDPGPTPTDPTPGPIGRWRGPVRVRRGSRALR